MTPSGSVRVSPGLLLELSGRKAVLLLGKPSEEQISLELLAKWGWGYGETAREAQGKVELESGRDRVLVTSLGDPLSRYA